MAQTLRLLMLEDNAADAELMVRELTRAGFQLQWKRVETEPDYLQQLREGVDLVLSDYSLPQFNGMRALELLKQSGLDIPFLLVSGTIGEDLAVEAMKHGAADYLLKDRLPRLVPAVVQALDQHRLQRERRQAEAALRASEARFSTMFRTSPAGAAISTVEEGRFIDVNEAFLEINGYQREEVLGHTAVELNNWVHPQQRDTLIAAVRERGIVRGFETQMRTKSGEIREVLLSVDEIELGGQKCLFSVSVDITLRKRTELALQKSEERYRQLFESGHDGVWVVALGGGDPQQPLGSILEVNSIACQRLGYTRQEMLGKTVLDIDQFMTAEQLAELAQRIQASRGAIFETVHIARDGQRVPVEVSCQLFTFNEKTSVLCVSRDLSERTQARMALLKSERRFRELVESAPHGIFVQVDGRFAYINQYAARLFGAQSPRLLLAQPILERFVPESIPSVQERLRQLNEERRAVPLIEERCLRLDGEQFDVEVSAVPFVYEDHRGALVFFREITDRKKLEAELRQAQKMEAVGQLAGGVAHDFNNILAAMLMQVELLGTKSGLDEETQNGLKELKSHSQRAANLTRQLLLFGRRSTLQLRALDLNEVVENLLKMLRRLLGEDIQIHFHPCSNLPLVTADTGMMEQVLMNLAVNARDAMPKGGQLSIRTDVVEAVPETSVGAAGSKPGRYVCLSVADTGCGMDEATLKRIFEPFFTTKDVGKGTGLGLATIYGILSQHKGWVSVQSVVGQGSTFRVFLPPCTEGARTVAPAAASAPARGGKETILLVEDDASVRGMFFKFLQRLGYSVIEAANGVEALRVWEQQGQKVDLLFTDMIMPEGMTGLELAQKIRASRPGLKVIISSGYSAELVQSNGVMEKGIDYLPKPCPPGEIANRIRACLDRVDGP